VSIEESSNEEMKRIIGCPFGLYSFIGSGVIELKYRLRIRTITIPTRLTSCVEINIVETVAAAIAYRVLKKEHARLGKLLTWPQEISLDKYSLNRLSMVRYYLLLTDDWQSKISQISI